MTVKQLTQIERYVGPSTATKPLDCSVGSTFLEEDTSRLFVFDGTGWFPKTQDIVIYDAEGNPLEIEGGRMKVSVDASVVAPQEVVWSNITLRDGQNPSNKLAVLPDGSLKVQQSGTIVELAQGSNISVTAGSTVTLYEHTTKQYPARSIRVAASGYSDFNKAQLAIRFWGDAERMSSHLYAVHSEVVEVNAPYIRASAEADVYGGFCRVTLTNLMTADSILASFVVLGVI